MITKDKATKIFCITDEFSKKFDEEIANIPLYTVYRFLPEKQSRRSLSHPPKISAINKLSLSIALIYICFYPI